MIYHPHIKEVRSDLEKKKDARLEVFRFLTEPKHDTYEEYYEKMWQSLFRIETKYCGSNNTDWIYLFLDDVTDFRKKLPYFNFNREQRASLLKDIKKHTDVLKDIFEDSGLNTAFISNDGQFSYGFQGASKMAITDVLDFFLSYAEDEVYESVQRGKIVRRQEVNRFVRSMGARNLERYNKVLAPVIVTATLAIYGQEYSISDVTKLVHGRKKSKTKK